MIKCFDKGVNKMTIEERYRERYKAGDTPWDVGQADFNLIEVVTKTPILSIRKSDLEGVFSFFLLYSDKRTFFNIIMSLNTSLVIESI